MAAKKAAAAPAKVAVSAIEVPEDFDPAAVDRSFDPNSGAVPQPGGLAAPIESQS